MPLDSRNALPQPFVSQSSDPEVRLSVGDVRRAEADALRGVLDALDHGCDGQPRHLDVHTRSKADRARLVRRVTSEAEARGFVVLGVGTYLAWPALRREPLGGRTLLLIATPDVSRAAAARALLHASIGSARGHVLLEVTGSDTVTLREARARFSSRPGELLRRITPDDREVQDLRRRAAHAVPLVTRGRHAAAGRLLREVAGAFLRRRRPDDAARVLIALGRLLLERGQCRAADDAFDQAASAARAAEDDPLEVEARLWQARARTDAGRLTEAESVCRAAMLLPALGPVQRLCTHAALAGVLLAQRRTRDAAALDLTWPAGADADEDTVAFVRATTVRMCLAQQRVFEAGLEARALLGGVGAPDSVAGIVAQTAHLRVLLAAGDLTLAQTCLTQIVLRARAAHAPLRVARARLLFAEALHRAGRMDAAARELRRLRGVFRAAPALLRREIEELEAVMRGGVGPARPPMSDTVPGAVPVAELIALAHDCEDDEDGIRRVLERLVSVFAAARIDVWSQDAGPPAIVMTSGSGLTTRLGPRALEAGIVVGPEHGAQGSELAVPVRRGRILVGAIVARWAIDRSPPSDARGLLETAAAIVCGRLEARQMATRLAAHTATLVPELVGVSAAMRDVRAAIARAAAAPFAVLIQGESGVGKELAARAIHQLSARRERPFCDVNCAALPEDLLESELFGHARGAFTGALTERAGLFEAATGGTVFLDEIADLSARGQAKLLRVLQQQEVRRVGETFSRPIDVRLVTAANRDLGEAVTSGRFRSDLLYRLDVIRLRIPPLRDRPEDVAPLALHLWRAAAARVETTATLTHGVLSALARYHWPGNVRELQNVVAALAVAAPARGQVRAPLLPAAIAGNSYVKATRLAEARAQFERRVIESALARHAGNRSRAARELGLSRQGLLKMMARLAREGGAAWSEPSTD